MAKKKQPAREALPAVGSAFLMPLQDGRFGVCRVLRAATPEEAKFAGASVLVGLSEWIGSEPPRPRAAGLRKLLRLTHHEWKKKPYLVLVRDPVPPDFVPLPPIAPSAAELEGECSGRGGWEGFRLQRLRQWRWDHDREALLAEDARRRAAEGR